MRMNFFNTPLWKQIFYIILIIAYFVLFFFIFLNPELSKFAYPKKPGKNNFIIVPYFIIMFLIVFIVAYIFLIKKERILKKLLKL